MRLKAITLHGFKTFAQRTELCFEGGVTAVVGPNGSGKSNIVDSFRWVLGESHAKDLRGSKMEEVVYNGGARRSRASTAEVTLLIDNQARRLPIDYQEVAITRRIDRSGQSDFLLNASRVRRRDILELLTSTGVTTNAYAIVDQRDIEHLVGCTPEQRRLLIEEAAQVRGVKAKRSEASEQLTEAMSNLTRLQDLRGELEQRLEVVRGQAAQAAEASAARERLELLRGSIAWEEWREVRERHKKAQRQQEALKSKLATAQSGVEAAEAEHNRCSTALQAAQDRRLSRQQNLGAARLELSNAEHKLTLTLDRIESRTQTAQGSRRQAITLEEQVASVAVRQQELMEELTAAEIQLAAQPEPEPAPSAEVVDRAEEARRQVNKAEREQQQLEAQLSQLEARMQLFSEQLQQLSAVVEPAEVGLEKARSEATAAQALASAAQSAAAQVARIKAELEGLEALNPKSGGDLKRVGEVIIANPGYEAALAAVLGPLLDAFTAPDQATAEAAAEKSSNQMTVLYPPQGMGKGGGSNSLASHVRCSQGFESLAARLLGAVEVGEELRARGVYREDGLIRAGRDPRTEIASRRLRLEEQLASLQPQAAQSEALAKSARDAATKMEELQRGAGQRSRLDHLVRQMEELRAQRSELVDKLPRLTQAAEQARAVLKELSQARDAELQRIAEHRVKMQQLEADRAVWRERARSLQRQLEAVRREAEQIETARQAVEQMAAQAELQRSELEGQLPTLKETVEAAKAKLLKTEQESPSVAAELDEAARALVAADQLRASEQLKASVLRENLALCQRELELSSARLEELRATMPEGKAPEDVPGGKAREREMRQLENRLHEIGLTNPLAAAECAELEQRYANLLAQLEDIAGARTELEKLITTLRSEEEERYKGVLEAVKLNFQRRYEVLTGGGQARLEEVAPPTDASAGVQRGVEILVQPPRKRMQRVSLLSSGERALTALALLFALQEVNPPPFTILDEVDAALDDANVGRFGQMLQEMGSDRQFLVITHNHSTMACCSELYGIHLDESGASNLVSVRLSDIVARDPVPAIAG